MSYTAGTIVYAKVKGFPWWPARIEAESSLPSNVLAKRPRGARTIYGVRYYGTRDYGWLRENEIKPFDAREAEVSLQKMKNKRKDKMLERSIREALDPSSFDDPMEEDVGNEDPAPDNDSEMVETDINQNENIEHDVKPKVRGRVPNKNKRIAPPIPARTERRPKSKRKTPDYSSDEDAVSRDKKRRTIYSSNRDSSSKPKQKQTDNGGEKMDIDEFDAKIDGETKTDVKTDDDETKIDNGETDIDTKTDGDIKTDTIDTAFKTGDAKFDVGSKADGSEVNAENETKNKNIEFKTDGGAKADNAEAQTEIEAKGIRRRQITKKDTDASNLGVPTRSTRKRFQDNSTENNSSNSAENSSQNSESNSVVASTNFESNTASNSADNPSSNTVDKSSLNTAVNSSSIPAANSSSISSENSSSISAENTSSGSDQQLAGDEITVEDKSSDNKVNKLENDGPSRSSKSRTKSPADRLKHLRHRIQRLMFPLSEDLDKTKVDEVLIEIENFPITIPLLKETKIGKVMRKIAELKMEPDPCNITQRSEELIKKWKGLLENNSAQYEDETSPAEEDK